MFTKGKTYKLKEFQDILRKYFALPKEERPPLIISDVTVDSDGQEVRMYGERDGMWVWFGVITDIPSEEALKMFGVDKDKII